MVFAQEILPALSSDFVFLSFCVGTLLFWVGNIAAL